MSSNGRVLSADASLTQHMAQVLFVSAKLTTASYAETLPAATTAPQHPFSKCLEAASATQNCRPLCHCDKLSIR